MVSEEFQINVSYFNNRKQFVSINGYISNLVDVNFRVLQGSILGVSYLH